MLIINLLGIRKSLRRNLVGILESLFLIFLRDHIKGVTFMPLSCVHEKFFLGLVTTSTLDCIDTMKTLGKKSHRIITFNIFSLSERINFNGFSFGSWGFTTNMGSLAKICWYPCGTQFLKTLAIVYLKLLKLKLLMIFKLHLTRDRPLLLNWIFQLRSKINMD